MTSETGKATGMGLATTFVIILATAVTWPLYKFVMVPLGLEFLQTLVIPIKGQIARYWIKTTLSMRADFMKS